MRLILCNNNIRSAPLGRVDRLSPVLFDSKMAEVYDLLFGGPGKESLAGCKDIILQATQALLVGKLRYELLMTLSFLNLNKKTN